MDGHEIVLGVFRGAVVARPGKGKRGKAGRSQDLVLASATVNLPWDDRQPGKIVSQPAGSPGPPRLTFILVKLADAIVRERDAVLFQPRQTVFRSSLEVEEQSIARVVLRPARAADSGGGIVSGWISIAVRPVLMCAQLP